MWLHIYEYGNEDFDTIDIDNPDASDFDMAFEKLLENDRLDMFIFCFTQSNVYCNRK